MSQISSRYSNYVEYTLDCATASPLVINEPIGWEQDDFELDRHKSYHGVFTSFTSSLSFYKQSMDYILLAYELGGINTTLTITKKQTKEVDGVVKMSVSYFGYANFNTMVIKDQKLDIQFTSDSLATLMQSHENDEFELDIAEDINAEPIDPLLDLRTEIAGRNINQYGQSELRNPNELPSLNYPLWNTIYLTPLTTIVSIGPENHASVDTGSYGSGSTDLTSSNFFYIRNTAQPGDLQFKLEVDYDFEGIIQAVGSYRTVIEFVKYRYDNPGWTEVDVRTLYDNTPGASGDVPYALSGKELFDVEWDEGVLIRYNNNRGAGIIISIAKQNMTVNVQSFYEPSPNLRCLFIHDVFDRLLYIITGKKTKFYSKYFGRTELGYNEDGEAGLIGAISGLWVRAFEEGTTNYKAMKMSLKNLMNSTQNTFNVGVGIEKVGPNERLRVEPLAYFYQRKTVVVLENPISEVSREVDPSLFFSGSEIGYEAGADYEDEMGLDEPNGRNHHVTPIRNSANKFKKLSKIRADEYGMELTRRKPQKDFPNEDTRQDEVNWYLDLKRTGGTGYLQKDPLDRLQSLPTGIFSPETFRTAYFTPLRIMFRHAFVFTSGMQPYADKLIKFISSKANSTLRTHFIGEPEAFTENEDILVSDLDRPKFLPEIVKFTHKVDDKLLAWLQDTTEIEVGGVAEQVPNTYFKIAYINEKGLYETGYLLNVKTGGKGEWTMQLTNEK